MMEWLLSTLVVAFIGMLVLGVASIMLGRGYNFTLEDFVGVVCIILFLVSCVCGAHEIMFGGGK